MTKQINKDSIIGAIIVAVLCIASVCSVCFGLAVCSAEEYTVTYIDATTKETITTLAKDGYTASGDVYNVITFDEHQNCDGVVLEEEVSSFKVIYNKEIYSATAQDSGDFTGVLFFAYVDGERVLNFDTASGSYTNTRSTIYQYTSEGTTTLYPSIDAIGSYTAIPVYYIKSESKNVDLTSYTVTSDCVIYVTYTAAVEGDPIEDEEVSSGTVSDTPVEEDPTEVTPAELKGWNKFVDSCKSNWNEFTSFFTEDIPNFFKVTIPEFFKGIGDKITALFKGD